MADVDLLAGKPSGTPLSSVASMGSTDSIIQRMEKNDAEEKAQIDKGVAKMEAEPRPQPPKMTPAPEQKDFQTDPMQTFGSAGMFLATFGSMMTKHPLTNALNSGAEVMKAANAKDANAFNKAFEKWKIDTENASKMAQWDMDQYKTTLGKDEAEMKAYAVGHKNDTARAAIEARSADQYHKDMVANLKKFDESKKIVNDYMDEGMKKFDKEHPGASEMERIEAKMNLYGKAKAAEGGFYAKEEFKEKEKGSASISLPTAKFAAEQVLAGDKSALSNYGRGEKATANLALIHEQIQQMAQERGISGADLARINAEFEGFKSEQRIVGSRAGAVTYAAAEVDQMMPLAKSAVSKIDLSRFPNMAALENYAKQHVGDQKFQFAYDTVQELQNAFTSLLVRNGVRSDAAQNLAEGVINLNMGSKNIAGAFDAIDKSKDAILRAAPAARKTIMRDQLGIKESDIGKPKPVPNKNAIQHLIDNPDKRDEFDEYYGQGAAANYLGGQ